MLRQPPRSSLSPQGIVNKGSSQRPGRCLARNRHHVIPLEAIRQQRLHSCSCNSGSPHLLPHNSRGWRSGRRAAPASVPASLATCYLSADAVPRSGERPCPTPPHHSRRETAPLTAFYPPKTGSRGAPSHCNPPRQGVTRTLPTAPRPMGGQQGLAPAPFSYSHTRSLHSRYLAERFAASLPLASAWASPWHRPRLPEVDTDRVALEGRLRPRHAESGAIAGYGPVYGMRKVLDTAQSRLAGGWRWARPLGCTGMSLGTTQSRWGWEGRPRHDTVSMGEGRRWARPGLYRAG